MRPLPLLLLLAACGSADADPADDPHSVWHLVSLDRAPLGAPVTLQFTWVGLAGRAPCNTWFANVEKGPPPAFVVGPVGGTELACDALAEEARFYEALSQVTELVRMDETLTFSGPEHVLVFAR